jgi:hypothetical protein
MMCTYLLEEENELDDQRRKTVDASDKIAKTHEKLNFGCSEKDKSNCVKSP